MQPQALRATEMRLLPPGSATRCANLAEADPSLIAVGSPVREFTSHQRQRNYRVGSGIYLNTPKRPIQASVGALHAMVGRRPVGGVSVRSALVFLSGSTGGSGLR